MSTPKKKPAKSKAPKKPKSVPAPKDESVPDAPKSARMSAAEELEMLLPRLTELAAGARAGKSGPCNGAWKPVYLSAIGYCANVTIACRIARVSRTSVKYAREHDPEFLAAEQEAMETGIDMVEASAFKSAVYGDLEPIYHQGIHCGNVLKFSDQMRTLILKGRRGAVFRDRIETAAKLTIEESPQTLEQKQARVMTAIGILAGFMIPASP